MFWTRSSRKPIEHTTRPFRTKVSANAVHANSRHLATDAEAKARDLSSVAIDQLLARIDDLAEAFSALSQDAKALSRSQAAPVMAGLIEELKLRPLRLLAIAVGVGMTAGFYRRK